MDSLFNKLYHFQSKIEWRLPVTAYKSPNFTIEALSQMKTELNQVKGQLDQFDLDIWTRHTDHQDLSTFVLRHIKESIKPELCTRAWCKFFEILSKFPSLVKPPVKSLHLCEAPGAFVCALNHYLVLHNQQERWKWFASTLNPYYEGNSGDRMLSYDWFISKTMDHWLFGADLTGDLLNWENHKEIVSKSLEVNLVTADGSINCIKDPGEQEKLVEFLHYCETLTALRVLQPGGNFVLKIFTIFEHATLCLVYLLNCVFHQVTVIKPGTSKSGNSEIYLVCLDYKGFSTIAPIWDQLVTPYRNGGFDLGVALWGQDELPKDFLDEIVECCQSFFLEKQCATITGNIKSLYDKPKKALLTLKYEVSEKYFNMTKIDRIDKKLMLQPLKQHLRHECSCDLDDDSTDEIRLGKFEFWRHIQISRGKRIETVYASKFWTPHKPPLYRNDPKYRYDLAQEGLKNSYMIIDGSQLRLGPHHTYQEALFTLLLKATSSGDSEGKSLICLNVPFHTHFLAGLWCVLSTAFEYVRVEVGLCIFYGANSKHLSLVKEKVFDQVEMGSVGDVLYVLDPRVFSAELTCICHLLRRYNCFYGEE